MFAVSGALVASRKGLDVMAFMWLAVITGVGGGTVRDLIDAPRFQEGRTTDYSFDLLLGDLPPDEYLLTIEASIAGRTVARAVRFRIKSGA